MSYCVAYHVDALNYLKGVHLVTCLEWKAVDEFSFVEGMTVHGLKTLVPLGVIPIRCVLSIG
jgi:hypothetical protein